MKILLGFAISFILLIHPSMASEMAKYTAILQGIDGVHGTESNVVLKAKLERAAYFPTYRRDLPGELVEFYYQDEELGAALTDGDGIAELTLPKFEKGLHKIKARLPQDSEFSSKSATVFLLVLEAKTPIAISDIDHTVSDASSWQVLLRPNEKLPPLKHAVEGIKFFSNHFQIIYLTARDDLFINKTKSWLDLYGFVKAPSFYWDLGNADVPSDHGDFKSMIIGKLKAEFKNILIGFGDKPHDIRAYRDHGLRSYYLGDRRQEIDPDGIKVGGWKHLLEHFKSNPIGTLSSDPVRF